MKYLVSGKVTISCYTVVEAESPEKAKEIASSRGMQMVDSAARHGQSLKTVWCHSGELDGVPEITEVEEER